MFAIINCVCLGFLSSQTQYYVSTSGSDSNSGTSIAEAWRTVQHAMDNATPNSVVNILAGTYNEKVEVNVSGTSGNPIIFRNYNNDVVTMTGTGIATPDAIIGIFDQSYITIQGLNISDNEQLDAQGIIVEGNCQGIELRNNDISKINFSSDPNAPVNASTNSQPIIVFGTNSSSAISGLVIDGNIVHDCRPGFSEALAVNGNVDGFEVTNNTVRDITNIGIAIIGHEGTASANDQARNGTIRYNTVFNCKSPYATAGGIYVDGGRDNVIENNTVHDCQWGIEVGCENIGKSASGIKVRNNILYNNDDASLAIGGYDYPSGSGKVTDCLFTNNSCYNNDLNSGGVGGVTGELSITYTENCTLKNNIFYGTNSAGILLNAEAVNGNNSINLALDYNLFYMSGAVEFNYEGSNYTDFAAYQSGTGQDANSLFSDPSYANPGTPDLHLNAASPAIDSGDPAFAAAAGETDMDGENRVQNARVDMGADEYNPALPVEYAQPLQAFPAPDYVELRWATSLEQNNDRFEVQRSDNAIDWVVLMRIASGQHTGAGDSYRIKDTMPLNGKSYYRLKQIDQNGNYAFSNTVEVSWDKTWMTLQAFPNPATTNLTLDFYNPGNEKMEVFVYDLRGRLLLFQQNVSSTQLELDVAGWNPGPYLVQIVSKTHYRKMETLVFKQ